MLYSTNPTPTDPTAATTYFSALHDSSPLLCVSPALVTVKLDRYPLLPLSPDSLSRNRTKGGARDP